MSRRAAAAATRPAAAAPPRRPLARLPRVLRAAGGELLDDHRAADQRGLRLHRRCSSTRCATSGRRTSRWRSTWLARPSATRSSRSTRPTARRHPTSSRARSASSRRCSTALQVPVVTAEGFEADDVIATLTVQAEREGFDVAIITGDRDAFQLVSDHVTVLYPRAGCPTWRRIDPAEVERAVRPDARRSTPTSRPCAATRATTCRASRAWGRRPRPSGSREFGSLAALVDRVDEVQGKAGDALREHLSSVVRNRRLTELVRDVAAAGRRPPDLAVRSWDRDEVAPGLRHPAVPGAARPALRRPSRPPSRRPTRASTSSVERARARSGRRLAGRARRGDGTRRGRGRTAPGAAAPATSPAVGARGGRRRDRLARPAPTSTPADDAALAGVARRPRPRQGAARRQGPAAGAWPPAGWRLDGVTSDTALSAYLALPGPAHVRPGRPVLRFLHRELRAETADDGQLSLRRRRRGRGGRGAGGAGAGRRSTSPTCSTSSSTAKGQTRAARDVELPLVGVLAGMERTGIAVDADHLADLQAEFAGEVKAAAAGGVRGRRPRVQPRLAQAAAGDPVRRARACRRPSASRPATPPTPTRCRALYAQTEHPLLAHLLRHRDVSKLLVTVEGLQKSVGRRRPHPHDATTRPSRPPAGCRRPTPTCRTSRSAPSEGRRIRAGVRRRARATRRCSPPTTARSRCGSWPTCPATRRSIEAFASGEDLHTTVASRVFEVAAGRGRRRRCAARIKAMSYGLAYGLSAYGLGQQLGITARGGAGPHGRVLRALRRRARLPAPASSTRPGGPATPRRCWGAAATCPT